MAEAVDIRGRTLSSSLSAIGCVAAIGMLGALLLPPMNVGGWAIPAAAGEAGLLRTQFPALLVASACTALVWLTYHGAQRAGRATVAIWLLSGCLLGFVAAGMLGSGIDGEVRRHLLLILAGYGAGLLSARLLKNPGRFTATIAAFATIQAVYMIYSLHGATAGSTPPGIAGLDVLLLFGLPCALVRAVTATRSLSMAVWLLSASAVIGAMILTWDRGVQIAVAAGLAWVLWRLIEHRRAAAIAVLLLLSAIPVLLFVHLPQGLSGSPSAGPDASYQLLAKPTVSPAYALTGMGAGHLSQSVSFADTMDGTTTTLGYAKPRSLFAYWWDEAGIAGVVLVICIFAVALSIALTRRSQSAACIGGIWVSLLVVGLFAAPFGADAQSCGNVPFGCLLGATILLAAEKSYAPVPGAVVGCPNPARPVEMERSQ